MMAGFLLSVFVFAVVASTTFVGAKPANAQYTDAPLIAVVQGGQINESITDALVEAAVTAVVNGVNYFTSQLAYQAAVALTSDCPGQVVCWDSKSFEQGFKEAWQGAIGEAIGTLSEQAGFTALGFDLCNPGVSFSLKIQLGLMDELKPPPPKCDFNALTSNWENFSQSVSSGEVLKGLKPTFEKGESPLAVSLGVMDGLFEVKEEAKRADVMKALMDASAGGGFGGISDPVSGRVKSPAAVTKDEFARMRKGEESAIEGTGMANAGSIAKGAVISVVLNAVQTFVMTLVARLINKLVTGLLSTEELIALQPDLILNPEGLLQPPGTTGAQEALATRFLIATPREAGIIDPVLEFSTCPGTNRGPNNCVLDQQLASAIRVADITPMTIRDAMEKGLVHGDWPLINANDRPKDQDPFCYTYGYCESNLKKLRAARIISIGWEIAASRSSVSNPVKLKDVVDAYNDCGEGGVMDDAHPWCKLIDPNWVLRAPLTQCRAMGWSDLLLSQDISSRVEQCLDTQTCLRQDDKGQCTGGWGYCTRERNIWRFNGDSCPASYNTCRTLKARAGDARNYLLNTIDHGECNSDNAGCRRYSTEVNGVTCTDSLCNSNDGCVCEKDVGTCSVLRNQESCTTPGGLVCRLQGACNSSSCSCTATASCRIVKGATSCVSASGDNKDNADDWRIDPARFFNKSVQACDNSANGCTALVKFQGGESLNLVKNPSFEELEDGDNNGTPDHAIHWTPSGEVPNNMPSSIILDGSKSVDGQNAVRLASTRETATCTLGSACTNDLGCSCAMTSGPLDDYTCKVVKGQTSCAVTNLFLQDGITVNRNTTYTVSYSLIPGSGNDTNGGINIQFRDWNNAPVTLTSSNLVTTTDVTGGTATVTCNVNAGGISVSASGTKNADERAIRPSCTFVVQGKDIRTAHLWLSTASGTNYMDAVQFEEGGGTAFHDRYGSAGTQISVKVPPASLGCTGDEGEPQECQSFAGICRDSEVGCDRYSPTNGDPAIPGIANPQDFCPSECAGYDLYKQEESDFDNEKFPVYFIPDTAKACTEADAGCSEFTNVETEKIDYYSRLRLCLKPDDPSVGTYYSWEGSDVSGYQLRVWSLKNTTDALGTPSAVAISSNDVVADVADIDAGTAPCTALDDNAQHCDSKSLADPTGSTVGLCTRDDIDDGDFDCREFYDADGNRHYRLLSKTIIASASCVQYRITTSTEDDCKKSNGRWDGPSGRCTYFADGAESRACTAEQNGCRAYKGNASSNVRVVLNEDFESGLDGWNRSGASSSEDATGTSGLSVTSESITVGGHSLKIGSSDARVEIGGRVAALRSYTLSFWARGSGTMSVGFQKGTIPTECTLSDACDATLPETTCPCITDTGLTCDVPDGDNDCDVPVFGGSIATALGPGTSLAFADANAATLAPTINLRSEWRRFELGPVSVAAPEGNDPEFGTYPSRIFFHPRGVCTGGTNNNASCLNDSDCSGGGSCANASADAYIDNVILTEVQDNFYVVRDSWTTPASCDTTTNGIPSPQEMLGCKEYTNSIDEKVYLRSFTSLCRERAVGCGAFSNTQNTLENPYAESFGAVCRLYEADNVTPRTCGSVRCSFTCNDPSGCNCDRTIDGTTYSCRVLNGGTSCDAPAPADAGASCVCNYNTKNPAYLRCVGGADAGDSCSNDAQCSGGSCVAQPALLGDVCRVSIGSSECKFDLAQWDSSTRLDENPDRVNVPADQRQYLVVTRAHMCSSDDIGCRVVGEAHETYEGICQNKDSQGVPITCNQKRCSGNGNSCVNNGDCPSSQTCEAATCGCGPVNNATCDIKFGESSCKLSFERGVIDKWVTKAVKDLPSRYAQILCAVTSAGCDEFTAVDGTFYFKDPGDKVCEFKEGASVNGQTRSGWFRKSATGTLFPCYPELLKNGSEFAMYKNADPMCRRNTVCNTDGGCLCYLPPNPVPVCKIVKGGTACGYQGWVGQCQAQYDHCEEFVDAFQTTPNNPEGTPYYYIVNQKLDRSSCAGTAGLKQGCVLFAQTSNTARLYSAATTYFKSIKEANNNKVSPVNCNITPHDPQCENRCFNIPEGICSGNNEWQCRGDSECRRCSNNPLKVCRQNSDCPGVGATCPTSAQTCIGDRRYTTACSADADCNASTAERCAGPGQTYTIPAGDLKVTVNDSNVILKVRPDRECAEWLACKSFETVWDEQKGQYRSICSGFSHCTENRQIGQAFECVRTVEPPRKKFTKEDYSARDVTWSGQEYSGYTIWNRYSPSFLTPISIVSGRCTQPGVGEEPVDGNPGLADVQYVPCKSSNECDAPNYCKMLTGICKAAGDLNGTSCNTKSDCGPANGNGFCSRNFLSTHRFAIMLDPSRTCEADTDCEVGDTGATEDGACVAHRCLYNFDGGEFSTDRREWAPRCRAFPEEDSPYGESVVDTSVGGDHPGYGTYGDPRSKKTNFSNTNVCGRGNDCECSYSRWQYGKGGGFIRYLSYPGSTFDGAIAYDYNGNKVDIINNNTEGVCIGGPFEGAKCTANRKIITQSTFDAAPTGSPTRALGVYDPCDRESGGQCQQLSSVNYIQGWQGFCIDLDKSLNINGDEQQYNCNLWLPVDRLAGSPDNYNQFEEAGFRPENPQLLYCKIAQGNQSAGTYKRHFHTDGDSTPFAPCSGVGGVCDVASLGAVTACLGAGGIAGGGACYAAAAELCPDPPCEAGGPWYDSGNWFDVNWEDFNQSSKDTSSLNVYRNEMTGIEIEIDTAEYGGKHGVFYLSEDNNWVNSLEWDSDHDPDSGTAGAKGELPAASSTVGSGTRSGYINFVGSGNGGPCTNWFTGDHEGSCENIGGDNNCLAAKAEFDGNGKFVRVRTNLCHNASFTGHQVKVHNAYVLLREQCVDVGLVHQDSKPIKNAAWTDRMYQAFQKFSADANYAEGGYKYQPHSDRPLALKPDIAPFGRLDPDTLAIELDGAGNAATHSTLSVRYPVSIYATEGGSEFTYLDKSLPGGFNNIAGVNKEIQAGGPTSQPIPDVGGTPFACIGPCAKPEASNKGDFNTAYNAGAGKLKQYFAVEYIRFLYDYDTGSRDFDDIHDGTGDVYTSEHGYDDRHLYGADAGKWPQVLSVVTSDCAAGEDGLCDEGGPGLTVNEVGNGSSIDAAAEGSTGRYRALIRYYAFADKDRMPIRRKIIDFGDGTPPVNTPGAFKNHRGCKSAGTCDSTKKICGQLVDGETWPKWGFTEQSCDPRYFQETHTYTCTPDMVGSGPSALPTCNAAEPRYPCKGADGSCRFKPRVQILDNWGYCNSYPGGGFAAGCPGDPAGNACFNKYKFDLSQLGSGDVPADPSPPPPLTPHTGSGRSPTAPDYAECHDLTDRRYFFESPEWGNQSKGAWTAFGGEIILRP